MSDTHAQNTRFVRDTMLEQQAPPMGETGAVKWVRENLLSSWLNILLTVAAGYLIYLVFHHVFEPRILNLIWNAGTLSECREVFVAHSTELSYPNGICWAVIRDRWVQLLMGSYPPQYYWRCGLAFVLLFVALAPVLYPERTPAALRIVTVIYPFVMPWLIWGGAFWLPLLAMMGFVFGYAAFRIGSSLVSPILGIVLAAAVPLAWWIYLSPAVNDGLHRMVAVPLIETTRVEQAANLELLEAELEELEAAQATLDEQISADALLKDVLIANIASERYRRKISEVMPDVIEHLEAAQSMGFVDALAELRDIRDILDPFNPDWATPELGVASGDLRVAVRERAPLGPVTDDDTLSEEAEDLLAEMMVLARQSLDLSEVGAMSDAVLADNVDEFDQRIDALTRLREESTAIGARFAMQDGRRQVAAGLVRNIDRLQSNQEELPEIQAAAVDLRAALPPIVAGIKSIPDDRSLLDPEITRDQLNDLEEAISAENRLRTAELNIDNTYKDVGRIGLDPVASEKFGGFQLGVLIGVAAIVMSLPLGILLALGRQSDLLIIKASCVTFIEVIRGIPLIVWLLVANFLLNFFLPPGTEFDKVLRVIIMVTFFSAAYIAEVVRGGLAALPKGQYEAADALGLDYWKSMRLIVLPQALKISIPGIVNTFIGLFKDTTLVVFIALLDPIGIAQQIRSDTDWNGIYWELFIFVGLIFFAFCFSMGRYSLFLERKLQRENR